MIDLNTIEHGDIVTVRDRLSNEATGTVCNEEPFCVAVFGVAIPFARRTRTGSVTGIPDIRVIAHQPQLVAP